MSKNKLIILISAVILIAAAIVGILVFKAESKKRVAFENKMQCETYKSEIENEINNEYGMLSYMNVSSTLNKIFYSPIENSCLYQVSLYTKEVGRYRIIIRDILAKSIVEDFDLESEYKAEEMARYEKFLADRKIGN